MIFRGKTALVTGASTGIGEAIATRFAKEGAKVALVGRNIERLNENVRSIARENGTAKAYVTDLREAGAIEETLIQVDSELGPVSVLANVAGVWHSRNKSMYGQRLDEISVEQIDEVLDVNLRGTLLLSRLTLRSMIAQRFGKIVNISGTFSDHGVRWLHYFVSKQAIEKLTFGLAEEVREYNIQVNCISPADVNTEAARRFFPEEAEHGLNPEDVAELAVFLCSDLARYITGQIIELRRE